MPDALTIAIKPVRVQWQRCGLGAERVRYTGMSMPYHAGNGGIGGLLPPLAFALVAASGSVFAGLWYPLVFALVTTLVGLVVLPETRQRSIHD